MRYFLEASATVNRLWVRFSIEKMKYLIFSFLHSETERNFGNEAERGVEFRQPTRNAYRISRKVGNESVSKETECLNTRIPCSLFIPYLSFYTSVGFHIKNITLRRKFVPQQQIIQKKIYITKLKSMFGFGTFFFVSDIYQVHWSKRSSVLHNK